jgi:hypothetical protein
MACGRARRGGMVGSRTRGRGRAAGIREQSNVMPPKVRAWLRGVVRIALPAACPPSSTACMAPHLGVAAIRVPRLHVRGCRAPAARTAAGSAAGLVTPSLGRRCAVAFARRPLARPQCYLDPALRRRGVGAAIDRRCLWGRAAPPLAEAGEEGEVRAWRVERCSVVRRGCAWRAPLPAGAPVPGGRASSSWNRSC